MRGISGGGALAGLRMGTASGGLRDGGRRRVLAWLGAREAHHRQSDRLDGMPDPVRWM